ncbi:MAG TPA: twin-arginine translocase TatA/TatE family subunit [Ignavibacteriales bacterium]|nr:twin-arginine translocase TatA/TatE family subunit [Ignavibacteriales bacterium]HOL81012.1 twin-arginine translocase TatA/TatE family subunit [Ignavibacteriales bacterium]HOM64748.1 twin-arginine translocase TatA/TatE family subunit [Ignavibacteriales bacterium]HPD66720.1 twin-arginine translocase TatA/TatE family subunit [Ignavibacteriales bacterium]HPP32792.1 twin-arginine translocase TatA/TatE family subunit [Ignavibacteriales bacterium]
MFSNIGFTELIIIMIIILIFFGPKKIPELAQSIGKGIKEFKKAMADMKDNVDAKDTKNEQKDDNNK